MKDRSEIDEPFEIDESRDPVWQLRSMKETQTVRVEVKRDVCLER